MGFERCSDSSLPASQSSFIATHNWSCSSYEAEVRHGVHRQGYFTERRDSYRCSLTVDPLAGRVAPYKSSQQYEWVKQHSSHGEEKYVMGCALKPCEISFPDVIAR